MNFRILIILAEAKMKEFLYSNYFGRRQFLRVSGTFLAQNPYPSSLRKISMNRTLAFD